MVALLTMPAEMSKALRGAMRQYTRFHWSVAWGLHGELQIGPEFRRFSRF